MRKITCETLETALRLSLVAVNLEITMTGNSLHVGEIGKFYTFASSISEKQLFLIGKIFRETKFLLEFYCKSMLEIDLSLEM